ncbi:MAG: hypothetical protein LBD75_03975 [Candidatus Peribacteria bacterium]|nr:hypothetical protein [Candidatus Peribacteria bacterium]
MTNNTKNRRLTTIIYSDENVIGKTNLIQPLFFLSSIHNQLKNKKLMPPTTYN